MFIIEILKMCVLKLFIERNLLIEFINTGSVEGAKCTYKGRFRVVCGQLTSQIDRNLQF